MSGASQSGGHKVSHQQNEPQKCFVAHSYQAEWHETIEAVCNELLPEYGLQPWYAEYNYDPNTTLRDKIVSMIDSAPYGIYDLSYWRKDEHSPWAMPCNVLIELGIAIALNRPTLLLRHTGNGIAGIALPKSLQSISQIYEFTGGDYSLEKALREHFSYQADLPTYSDWQHYHCCFGEINCSYLQVYPHTALITHDKLHCHIADGPDTDQLDFRRTVEAALGKFNNISYSYLDKGNVPIGYTFLLCSHCQLVRSTPFAIYRITPDTSPETYIAIGISIGLEYRFHYKIPRFMITRDMQHVPSLLQGYQCVPIRNLHTLKTTLPQFVQQILTKMDERAYWRPQELPFEICVPSGVKALCEDMIEEKLQKTDQAKVLVAVENASLRSLLVRVLVDDGYNTFEARNGAETLKKLQEYKPDICLLDIYKSDLNGYDVLKRMSINPVLSTRKVIMLTSLGATEDMQCALTLGARACIPVPFELNDLFDTVEQVLKEV